MPEPQHGYGEQGEWITVVELELCPPAKLLAPADLQLACREVLDGESPASSSKLHQDVSAELARMGIAHENKLSVSQLGYRVDIAILLVAGAAAGGSASESRDNESRDNAVITRAMEAVRAATIDHAGIVIEVDGPTHYLNERRLRPALELIRRHLAVAGWVVLVVPYWEWEALKGRAKAEYVVVLLERAASRREHG
ncbi:hypothetical protein T492DRAFT_845377 [Pavlovales sp. CCMP2436]|nr:hypothetical protein T492DRAFT_845377 [Pavlovales sp. CCMP2436]